MSKRQHMSLSRGVPIAYSLPTWLIMEAFINLADINLACFNLACINLAQKNHGLCKYQPGLHQPGLYQPGSQTQKPWIVQYVPPSIKVTGTAKL